jgi:hypothetical protein
MRNLILSAGIATAFAAAAIAATPAMATPNAAVNYGVNNIDNMAANRTMSSSSYGVTETVSGPTYSIARMMEQGAAAGYVHKDAIAIGLSEMDTASQALANSPAALPQQASTVVDTAFNRVNNFDYGINGAFGRDALSSNTI